MKLDGSLVVSINTMENEVSQGVMDFSSLENLKHDHSSGSYSDDDEIVSRDDGWTRSQFSAITASTLLARVAVSL